MEENNSIDLQYKPEKLQNSFVNAAYYILSFGIHQ